MTISLAFLAPNLVKAAIEGCLPRGIGIERLRDLPERTDRDRVDVALWYFSDMVRYPDDFRWSAPELRTF